MSSTQYEANSSTIGSGACSYATLSHYNNGSKGMRPPISQSTVSGTYIVPTYDAPGYDTLTGKGCGNCAGYFNIGAAYKSSKDGSCNPIYNSSMSCNGN